VELSGDPAADGYKSASHLNPFGVQYVRPWPKTINVGHGLVASRIAQETGLSKSKIGLRFWPVNHEVKEMRLFLARRVLVAGTYVVLVALAGGAVYQAGASRIDMRRNPAPGKLVDIGGFKLHINCKGEGEPTVVFDSGMADDSIAWYKVQPQVAKFIRACSYDRAGLGWSEPSPNPRTSATIVKELHSLLRISNISPPYILVGHSFGGMNVRLYSHSYPTEVAGLILVDSSSPDQFRFLPPAIQAYNASFLRRQGYFQATMLVGWPRISGWCDNWPAEVRDQRRATECRRQPWVTHLAEYESFDESSREVAKASKLGSLPLIVLSHDTSAPGPTATAWMTMQKNLAKLSSRGVLEIVPGGTHNLQEDHPGPVIDAARSEVEEVCRGRHNCGAGTIPSKPGFLQQ